MPSCTVRNVGFINVPDVPNVGKRVMICNSSQEIYVRLNLFPRFPLFNITLDHLILHIPRPFLLMLPLLL